EFLEHRWRQPSLSASAHHALHATAPLLDKSKRVEHSPDHSIAKLRDTLLQVFNRQPERQQTRIFDLDPIVKDCDADRRSTLRVIGVNDRVDDRFAYRHGW